MGAAYRTQAADNDLRNIAFQIGVESGRPVTADRIIDELVDYCDQLAELPPASRPGTHAPELGRGIRLVSHRRWVIIFRYIGDDIVVLRIADGRQDYLAWKL